MHASEPVVGGAGSSAGLTLLDCKSRVRLVFVFSSVTGLKHCSSFQHVCWGTMKVTTTNSLTSAISKFCDVTSVKFKRKTVCDSAGQINYYITEGDNYLWSQDNFHDSMSKINIYSTMYIKLSVSVFGNMDVIIIAILHKA